MANALSVVSVVTTGILARTLKLLPTSLLSRQCSVLSCVAPYVPTSFRCAACFSVPTLHRSLSGGNEENKYPNGRYYNKKQLSLPPQTPEVPSRPGRFQYIRMELVNEGDAEELIKRQPGEALQPEVARAILFQISFALHAAADKFSVKHYDIKLLNIFVQNVRNGDEDVIMRYSLGSHIFELRLPPSQAFMAKLADFGTANTIPASNGQPVTIAQITTLENTPPDFMIIGDEAKQGKQTSVFYFGPSC